MENQALRRAREYKGWSQRYVAEQVDTNRFTVTRWESGHVLPSPHFRRKLCELFQMNAQELGLLRTSASDDEKRPYPSFWNVPYRRNPFFTGREDILAHLYSILGGNNTIKGRPIHALSGLGGIGKTQAAVEYAYRYGKNYQAVLWVQGDSYTNLVADIVKLAGILNLAGKTDQNVDLAVAAVQSWLKEQTNWLLILDNVEDIQMISRVLPSTYTGHILLTTRMQATGADATCFEIEKMNIEEGALFLLRRVKLLELDAHLNAASEGDRSAAQKLSQLMDGLPLALDQAAAYIEESGCGVPGYLKRYQHHRNELLGLRGKSAGHPESLTTTWSLSFEMLQRSNKDAADLLYLCAFLYPDAIVEDLLLDGAFELPSLLQSETANLLCLDTLVRDLRKFSFVRRNAEANMLTIHRLVQAVLQERMDEHTRRTWAEHAVRLVNCAFPEVTFATWQRCQLYLPQALECAKLISQWNLTLQEAVRLLNQAATYLREQAQYAQAEILYRQALTIREQTLDTQHLEIADSLHNIALLYAAQGNYDQAELLYQRALHIREHTLGCEQTSVAITLNDMAELYLIQKKYHHAELLYLRALHILEQTVGLKHPYVATSLHGLAKLYSLQGKRTLAEPMYQQALVIREQTLGKEHPDTTQLLADYACYFT